MTMAQIKVASNEQGNLLGAKKKPVLPDSSANGLDFLAMMESMLATVAEMPINKLAQVPASKVAHHGVTTPLLERADITVVRLASKDAYHGVTTPLKLVVEKNPQVAQNPLISSDKKLATKLVKGMPNVLQPNSEGDVTLGKELQPHVTVADSIKAVREPVSSMLNSSQSEIINQHIAVIGDSIRQVKVGSSVSGIRVPYVAAFNQGIQLRTASEMKKIALGREKSELRISQTRPISLHKTVTGDSPSPIAVGASMNGILAPSLQPSNSVLGHRVESSTLNVARPDWQIHLGNIIHKATQQEDGTIQVKVHPQGMGDLLISVRHTELGVQIHMEANQFATAEWLGQQSLQLTNTVTQAGVNVANVQVTFGQANFNSSGFEQSSKKRGQSDPPMHLIKEGEPINNSELYAIRSGDLNPLGHIKSSVSFRA